MAVAKAAHEIPNKLFYKIGEVCEITDTQPYVLRFWESEFPQLAPRKNRSGQRVYQRKDIETVIRIKKLLYEEEYTIAGARKKLEDDPQAGGAVTIDPASLRGTPSEEDGPDDDAHVVEDRQAEADHPVDLIASRTRGRAPVREEPAKGEDPEKEARLEAALGELKKSLKDVLAILRKES